MKRLSTATAALATLLILGAVAWVQGQPASISQNPWSDAAEQLGAGPVSEVPIVRHRSSCWDLPPEVAANALMYHVAPHAELWQTYCIESQTRRIKHSPHRNWHPLVHLKCRVQGCTEPILAPAREIGHIFVDLLGFHRRHCGCNNASCSNGSHCSTSTPSDSYSEPQPPTPLVEDDPEVPLNRVPDADAILGPVIQAVPLDAAPEVPQVPVNDDDDQPLIRSVPLPQVEQPDEDQPRVPRNQIPQSRSRQPDNAPTFSQDRSSRRQVPIRKVLATRLSDYID